MKRRSFFSEIKFAGSGVVGGTRTRASSSSSIELSNSLNADPSSIGLFGVDDMSSTPGQIIRRETFPVMHKHTATLLVDDSIELNVGGNIFTTSGWVLAREHTSWLANHLDVIATKDRRGRYFIDRDGELFHHILQYLRTGELQIPKDFKELKLLRREAIFYGLKGMSRKLDILIIQDTEQLSYKGNYITLTEHATYNIRTRDNVKIVFKRISSITVAGHVQTCRKVFRTHLSLDRDSHDNQDRYSCRMVMVQGISETFVFDLLRENGYEMVANNKTDAATLAKLKMAEYKPEQNKRWIHVTNYYFRKLPK